MEKKLNEERSSESFLSSLQEMEVHKCIITHMEVYKYIKSPEVQKCVIVLITL